MNYEVLLDTIAAKFNHEPGDEEIDVKDLVKCFLDELERGALRCARKTAEGYAVDARVKQGILLAFRIGEKTKTSLGPFTFIDKNNMWPRSIDLADAVRIVPGGSAIRRGAAVGKNVVMMPPSYINIGALVDDGCLIDSHALVGSCAQIGKRVHISAGAQIGGVLEPVGDLPVIIEDDVLVGGNCGIYEGTVVGERAVLAAGVILTKSTRVFDLVHEKIIVAADDETLIIPAQAVVVPGSRTANSEFARKHGLAVSCPLIVKYRDEKTAQKTTLESLLREG